MTEPRVDRTPVLADAERGRRSRRVPRGAWVVGLVALLALPGLLVVPLAGATPAPSSGFAPASAAVPGPTQSWAWGAVANLSFSEQLAGAFNASSTPGANFTQGIAYGALSAAIGERYGAYEIVNATATTNSSLYVTVQAADVRAVRLDVAFAGTFPAAGTYPNGALPTLATTKGSMVASIEVVDAYAAFLNLTTTNGSVALADEHVEALRAFNISATLTNFPNATKGPNGSTTIRYTSGSVAASGIVFTNVSATFAPAVTLVPSNLSVGSRWSVDSTGAFTGETAWAVSYRAWAPGAGSSTSSAAASASATASVPVEISCEVVGTQVVYPTGGAPESDAVIACTNETGNSATFVAGGLAVLPTDTLTSVAQNGTAAPETSAPPATAASVPSRTVYSPSRGLPDSAQASPSSTTSVTATPVTPHAAQASITELRSPTNAPTVSPPAGAPAPAAPSNTAGVLLAGIGVVALGMAGVALLIRREVRRRR